MKIAIPTNDKYNVADLNTGTHYFKIFHILNDRIVKEEYRLIHKGKIETAKKDNNLESFEEMAKDCEIIIANSVDSEFNKYLIKHQIQIITTDELNITTAINHCICDIRLAKSNLCCQP
jgi:hypothetical protein